jgi:hypothetical protein
MMMVKVDPVPRICMAISSPIVFSCLVFIWFVCWFWLLCCGGKLLTK